MQPFNEKSESEDLLNYYIHLLYKKVRLTSYLLLYFLSEPERAKENGVMKK